MLPRPFDSERSPPAPLRNLSMRQPPAPFLAVFALAALVLLPFAGCATPPAEVFAAIRPGMTQDEVVAALGEPSSRHRVPGDERALRGYAERYHYGDTIGSLASQVIFSDLPDPRVWSVLFDAEGRVVGVIEPEPDDALPPRRLETAQ